MLRIAKILKSHGTDGGLLIAVRDISVEDINQEEPVYIEFDGLPVPFFIDDLTPRGTGKAVVHLTDIRTLADAEEVVGEDLLADYEFEEEEDELTFLGWTLLNRGVEVGVVADFEPIPGNLCLYVDTPRGRAMIPVHEDFIISADPATRRLDLDLPDGLL